MENSAVKLRYVAEDGTLASKKVLMHKRRVSELHLRGTEPVNVCLDCFEAFHKATPVFSRWCLANFNWLGRHLPLFRNASLGHQLLLALGRVVSTKLYLPSSGAQVAGMYRDDYLFQRRPLQSLEQLPNKKKPF